MTQPPTITTCAIGELQPALYNPRDMPAAEMQKLKASLKEFGVVQPIVARTEDKLVLGGHQRLQALKELLAERGMTPAEVASHQVSTMLLVGLDDARAKVLNLALNKISGEWDYAKLNEMFTDLAELKLPDNFLEVSGFTLEEITDISSVMGDPTLNPAHATASELAEGLASQARKFSFSVETDSEAAACKEALAFFGMTGPGNAAQAFVAAVRHAFAQKDSYAQPAPKPAKGGKKQKAAAAPVESPAAPPQG